MLTQPFKVAAAVLALLSLGSCSRLFLVKVALIDGTPVFSSDDDALTSYPRCWGNLTVVNEEGRAVWEFEVPYGAFKGNDKCGPNFPVRYGNAPPKAETMVAPQALETGKAYIILGHSAGLLEGAFRLEKIDGLLTVQNLSPESEMALKARDSYFAWQQAHDPSRVSHKPTEHGPFVEPLPDVIPRDTSKGSSGRDDFTWVLGPDEWWNLPSLSYQTLDAQQVKFNLWCRYTNGPLYVRVPPPAKRGTLLKFNSGPQQMFVRSIGAGNPSERSRIDGVLPWDFAPLRNFAVSGKLTLEMEQVNIALDAINNKERAVVSRFFQLCAGQLPHAENDKLDSHNLTLR